MYNNSNNEGFRRPGGFGHEGERSPRPRFRRDGESAAPRPRFHRDGASQRPVDAERPFRSERPAYSEHAERPNRPFGGKPKRNKNLYSAHKQQVYREQFEDPTKPVRLNKYLANAGICSRREADDFIQAGVITVNGVTVDSLGAKVLPTDDIRFHDQPVRRERKVYILLNKPKNTVTTTDDPQERHTVIDIIRNACPERVYPVGRLDRNTTGVLLLTNDGDLAAKLTHPKFQKKKIYAVTLDRELDEVDEAIVRSGVVLDDERIIPDALEFPKADRRHIGLEIHSGQNRVVRRIFEKVGYKVVNLDRVSFAGLTKKKVGRGKWRFLTPKEVAFLQMGNFE
jgi:23S rRNA pseudouridine2605 synthase